MERPGYRRDCFSVVSEKFECRGAHPSLRGLSRAPPFASSPARVRSTSSSVPSRLPDRRLSYMAYTQRKLGTPQNLRYGARNGVRIRFEGSPMSFSHPQCAFLLHLAAVLYAHARRQAQIIYCIVC